MSEGTLGTKQRTEMLESAMPTGDNLALRNSFKRFAVYLAVLSVCFSVPLFTLVKYSLHDQFFSYIPLIPVIAGYLIWIRKAELPTTVSTSPGGALIAAVAGIGFIAGWLWMRHVTWHLKTEDYLTFMTSAYLLFAFAGALFCIGWNYCRDILFPIAFLIFMIPMPSGMLAWTESFFQYTSAVAAESMLSIAQMPTLRDGLTLKMPGFEVLIAPECSGIHSTMVLLITALLAGHLFLRSNWKRLVMVAIVVPLAIVRNGFRIFVISELCVRISPDMIDSPIHHHGGPIFFALSLIPFFALLVFLRKSESNSTKTVYNTAKL